MLEGPGVSSLWEIWKWPVVRLLLDADSGTDIFGHIAWADQIIVASCQYKASTVSSHVLLCYTEPCARASLSSAGVHMPLMLVANIKPQICELRNIWVGVYKLWNFDSTKNPVRPWPCWSQWLLWPCADNSKSCNSQRSHWLGAQLLGCTCQCCSYQSHRLHIVTANLVLS